MSKIPKKIDPKKFLPPPLKTAAIKTEEEAKSVVMMNSGP